MSRPRCEFNLKGVHLSSTPLGVSCSFSLVTLAVRSEVQVLPSARISPFPFGLSPSLNSTDGFRLCRGTPDSSLSNGYLCSNIRGEVGIQSIVFMYLLS